MTLQMSCTVAETESFLLPQKFNLLFERSFHICFKFIDLFILYMLYVFYSIHMIAYSGGAPIQSSLRRPSGSNKALVLSESSDISLTVLNREKSNGIWKHRGFYLRYFACK